MTLLTREQFRQSVFARDNHKCVFCGKPAIDAHHIIDRSIWESGGYYLDNGVSLCGGCHWLAEQSKITPRQCREAAYVDRIILPEGLSVEGYVVRTEQRFPLNQFHLHTGKYVRANHVQTDQSWWSQALVTNSVGSPKMSSMKME